jgi:2-methylcitrate dehydratase PrpD
MRLKNLATAGFNPEVIGASTTSALAEFVVHTAYSSLPETVIRATKRIILDTVAVTIFAHGTPMADAVLNLKLDPRSGPNPYLHAEGFQRS